MRLGSISPLLSLSSLSSLSPLSLSSLSRITQSRRCRWMDGWKKVPLADEGTEIDSMTIMMMMRAISAKKVYATVVVLYNAYSYMPLLYSPPGSRPIYFTAASFLLSSRETSVALRVYTHLKKKLPPVLIPKGNDALAHHVARGGGRKKKHHPSFAAPDAGDDED